MSLDLDDRQRAMLAEMDVHVWWPHTPSESEPSAAALDQVAPHDLQADSDRQSATEEVAVGTHAIRAINLLDAEGAVADVVPTQRARSSAVPPTVRSTVPRAPIVAGPSPTALAPLPTGIEQMDWPTLRATVASCQACAMCLGRRAPVVSALSNATRADWLVLGEPPDDAQERTGEPFVEDAGLLLDNMLKAVGVRRLVSDGGTDSATDVRPDPASTAYLSLVLKCRPALPTAPDVSALAACAHFLRREIALVQPKVILAMGRLAMQLLLSEDHPQGLKLPLGKLRGQVWHYQGVPVVVTYPPAYLLRTGQDKARAWEDLCLALNVAQGRPDPGVCRGQCGSSD